METTNSGITGTSFSKGEGLLHVCIFSFKIVNIAKPIRTQYLSCPLLITLNSYLQKSGRIVTSPNQGLSSSEVGEYRREPVDKVAFFHSFYFLH